MTAPTNIDRAPITVIHAHVQASALTSTDCWAIAIVITFVIAIFVAARWA